MLNKFSEAIRSNLTKMQRSKIVAVVTIEVHARDIIEKLAKTNVNDVNSFEWLSQLRLYWDKVSQKKIFKSASLYVYYNLQILKSYEALL